MLKKKEMFLMFSCFNYFLSHLLIEFTLPGFKTIKFLLSYSVGNK